MWPTFPIQCGVYSLDNYKRVGLEIEEIQSLNFPTILNRKYDHKGTAKKFTAQSFIKQFMHEPNKFDDLFESTFAYSMVVKLVATQLTP